MSEKKAQGEGGDREVLGVDFSKTYMAEIVGEESLAGHRMQAGAILDLMDIAAGRVAVAHARCPAVTLSFDRVDLTQPILHQDLVHLDAQLVMVGSSSMVVYVQGYRKDRLSREFFPTQRSFITFVAIDENGRPKKDIPTLALSTPEEKALHQEALSHRENAKAWAKHLEEVDWKNLSVATVEDALNREKRDFLTPEDTTIQVRRIFLPRNTNVLGAIFGGDILLWMDRVATYTARQFTRNPNMVTLAMNQLVFKKPIYASDAVEMTARVVYVRHHTLEVEIEVNVQRMTGETLHTHSGQFVVLNYDEAGFKRPILTGLALSDDDPESLTRYKKARDRHAFWKDHT